MILQYRGYKGSWCYREAEVITHSPLCFETAIKKAISEQKEGEPPNVYDAIIGHIIKHFGLIDEGMEIAFVIGDKKISELKDVEVVRLDTRGGTHMIYVLDVPAYLLNNQGGTAIKLR